MKRCLSKILRVIVVFCIMVSMSWQLCACSGKTEEVLPNKQDMLDQIDEYKDQAKFTSVIELYRKLKLYDYISDDDLKFYEKKYEINSFVCYWIESSIEHLKEELKDPYSLVVYGVKIEMCDDEDYDDVVIELTLDYGAKNSFGGMVRENYSHLYDVSFNKDRSDDVKYAIDNHEITKESQFDAIINGTAEYDKQARDRYIR